MIDLDHLRAIGTLLDYGRQVSDHSGVVTRAAEEIERLREALTDITEVAERVDGWQSFPRAPIDKARAALSQGEA